MLGTYDGADGLKTGYTAASGFNLVMSAMRDNRRLIGVVMGGDSAGQRDRMMAELMDRGFAIGPDHAALALDAAAQAAVGALHRGQFRSRASVIPETTPRLAAVNGRTCASRRRAPAHRSRRARSTRVAGPPRAPAQRSCPPSGQPVDRQLGDPGRLVQRSAGRPARPERASSALPDAMRSPAAPRPSTRCRWPTRRFHRARLTNLSQATGGRRLQAAREAQDLLLGDPGHGLEYAGRALKARLQPRPTNARL